MELARASFGGFTLRIAAAAEESRVHNDCDSHTCARLGANTAIFNLVNTVLLSPLPYPQPKQRVTIDSNQSLLDFVDIQAQSQSYEAIGGVVLEPMDYTGEAEPIQVQAGFCNADLFRALGVQPELGRTIGNEEDQAGGARAVVLSHGFWQRHFGGDRNVIGR
jgi:hypothetical protein